MPGAENWAIALELYNPSLECYHRRSTVVGRPAYQESIS